MRQTKQGPLYDAARMLRVAAARLTEYADMDAATTYDDVGQPWRAPAMRAKISQARANIDAATARLSPYERQS